MYKIYRRERVKKSFSRTTLKFSLTLGNFLENHFWTPPGPHKQFCIWITHGLIDHVAAAPSPLLF